MNNATVFSETNIAEDLVSPHLCTALHNIGITSKVAFQYRIGADFCIPFTYAFDTEKIYEQMDINSIQLCGLRIIPAYRVSDVEKCFDGYDIKKESAKKYQVTSAHGNKMYTAFSETLPDVIGLLLFTMLQGGKVPPDYFNQRILSSE